VRGREIGGKRFSVVRHTQSESYPRALTSQKRQPTAVGRQVFCGIRQSMPDRR
jgi:hypothetical protein